MARYFNGTDARVDCGGRLPLDGITTNPCTFTFWVRKQGYSTNPDTVTHLESRILSRETDFLVKGVNILRGWAISLSPAGAITFTEHRRLDDRDADRSYTSPLGLIQDDVWTFVALTTLPTTLASDIHLFTSTTSDTTGAVEVIGGTRVDGGGNRVHAIDFGMVVGASHHNEGVRAWFRGEIGQLCIYREVLTRFDINRVRCQEDGFRRPSLQCRYNFTVPGTFETDTSGKGNQARHFNTLLVSSPPPVPCYGVTGDEPTTPPDSGPEPGTGVPDTGNGIPQSNDNSNPSPGVLAIDNEAGRRTRTQFRVIRARQPGHSSRRGGRYW